MEIRASTVTLPNFLLNELPLSADAVASRGRPTRPAARLSRRSSAIRTDCSVPFSAFGPSLRYTCSIGGGSLSFGSGILATAGVSASVMTAARGSPAVGFGRAALAGTQRLRPLTVSGTFLRLHFLLPLPFFFAAAAVGEEPEGGCRGCGEQQCRHQGGRKGLTESPGHGFGFRLHCQV